ncbi:Zinc finger, CCCH-type [Parasponia andersonii]|uniref:Zinc finger, CCCH-type n=1 Tax=Parasponia andersonii TaxID=3476 RepID=A0A2P5CGF3_PARAD|nr:Zinc finger, CCCH-type [Parasponia andersonii]
MDLPNLLHHHHHQPRYVPLPNSSRPHHPDNPNFHNNPRFQPQYHHHNHHVSQPQPQPTLPPPPPKTPPFQSLPPPPPPPPPHSSSSSSSSAHHPPPPIRPYNPGQSQFAFGGNPNLNRPPFEDDHLRSSHPHRDFVLYGNVSHRVPLDDGRPRHRLPQFEPQIRPEIWDQPRVLPEHQSERLQRPLDFECGSQKFQFDHKSVSPYKVLRHDSEGSSRFIGEYVDGFESMHRDELLRGGDDENCSRRGSFLSSPGTSLRDTGFASNPSLSVRDLELETDSYNGQYSSAYDNEVFRSSREDGVYDKQRWLHDKKFPRDAHKSSFERGSTEISNGDDENYSRRGSFLSSPGTSFRDMGFVSNPSLKVRDLESETDSCSGRYGSTYDTEVFRGGRRDGLYDNQRRVRDRKFPRDAHNSSFERGNTEITTGDGAHMGSVKREYYGPDLGRYSSRGSREDNNEYNRTPRKQLQKKSALLRIQMAKPNHRNAESEHLHYPGYLNNSNSSFFRRKDQYVYEEEREGSPIELDVSFKSNSLVAKAIMAPSSSFDVTDADLTLREMKIREDSLSDKDCSNAELAKLSDSTANVDSSMYVGKNTSNHDDDTIPSEENVVKNMCDTTSQASVSVTNQSVEKSEVKRSPTDADLDKDCAKVAPDKVSLKVPKKKKVVKKVIKRVVRRPHSHKLSSQQKKQHDRLLTADASIPTPSESSAIDKVVADLSGRCPNEVDMLHEREKVEGSPMAIDSEEHGVDINSSLKCVDDIEKDGNSLINCSGSSSRQDEGPENAECSVQGLPTILNSNKDLVKSLNVSTLPDIAHVVHIEQSCQNGDSLLLDSGLKKESLPVTLPPVGKVDSDLLNSGKTKMHDSLMNTYRSDSCTLDIVNGTNLSKEESRVCDVGTFDALSKLQCSIQVTSLQEKDFKEEVSKAHLSAESSAPDGSSSVRETTMDVDSSHHDRTTFLGYNNECNFEEDNGISGRCTIDRITKPPSTDGATEFAGNFATISSPNNKISFGGNEGDTPLTGRKRTFRNQLDFLRTNDIDLDAVDVSNPTTAVDTTLSLSFEDPDLLLHGNGSSDGFPDANLIARDDVNNGFLVTSSPCRKKRKVVASHLAIPSLTISETDEKAADRSTSCAEAPVTSDDVLTELKTDCDTFSAASNLMHSESGITVLYENKLSEESSVTVGAVKSFFSDENMKSEHQLGCCPNNEKSNFPTVESLCPKGSGHELKKVDAAVMAVNDQQVEAFNIGSGEEMLGLPSSREQVIAQDETPQCMVPSAIQPLDIDRRFSLPDDHSGVSTTTSNDEAMELAPDTLTVMGSPQSSFNVSNVHISDAISVSQLSSETCREDGKLVEKSVDEAGFDAPAQKSFLQCTDSNVKSDCATESDQAIEGKTVSLPLQDSRSVSQGLNINSAECTGQKNQLGHAIPRTFPSRSSYCFTTLKKKSTSIHANPRTWHRNSASSASPLPGSKPSSRTVPSQSQLPERDGNIHSTSYVRKGNSLVRKPSSAASSLPQGSPGFSPSVYRLKSPVLDESKRSGEPDYRVDSENSPGLLRMGETKSSCDKPRTPLIESDTKLPDCVAISSRDCTSFPSAGPLLNGCCETTSDPTSSLTNNDTTKFVEDSLTSENQNGQPKSLENQTELNDGKLAYLNTKRIVYVKRKSNQLVATTNSTDLPAPNAHKMQASSFDGYYKRRKNQLIRTSLESHTRRPVMLDENLNPGVKMALKAISSIRLSKRRSQKVVAKTFKRSANSLVWTLCSSQSSENNSGSVTHQKVYPHLFPWKRTAYWRSTMQNWNLISKCSSLAISGKLLLTRKRDTVYTRSINGFSLRKSKVLSVGGSSLKWSKSIDRHSKKANEEATLAVAAVERKKREQKGATRISSGAKDRNHSSRERTFRIGLCRYKMDPSRRTLQRISDDESSFSATNPDKDAKRSYIPRRLVIGHKEYIRIGNGNQLIRDPKKRSRLLASEKVRWSLHTARLRLARKRKYCQFFTRFGKCNKDNGRCPYIHDPSKIAVCTKFLNGLCSNANCKLTHKVIPERMPDCSYFLQGLCTNQSCPYRHVNVNPKAITCEGFLKGYCADGNECQKKHSYVCSTFEATGTCPQGSKCKLHHPKNRIQEKKRKQSREVRNARGRYFGSPDLRVFESKKPLFEKNFAQDYNDIISDGSLSDFIAIDVSDDDFGEYNDAASEQTTFCDSDTSDLQQEDLDELIKPIRLMDASMTS